MLNQVRQGNCLPCPPAALIISGNKEELDCAIKRGGCEPVELVFGVCCSFAAWFAIGVGVGVGLGTGESQCLVEDGFG